MIKFLSGLKINLLDFIFYYILFCGFLIALSITFDVINVISGSEAISTKLYAASDSLQTGGSGPGYAFAAISDLEWQSRFFYESHIGKEIFDELRKEKKSSKLNNKIVQNSLGYRAGKQFLIIGYADGTFSKYSETMRELDASLKSHSNIYDLGARVVFDRRKFIFAGSFGIRIEDDYKRTLNVGKSIYETEYSTATYPKGLFSFGYQGTSSMLLAQVALPSKIDIEAHAGYKHYKNPHDKENDNDNSDIKFTSYHYDYIKPTLLKSSLHFLQDFDTEFQITASLHYLFFYGPSLDIHPYSMKTDEKDARILANKPLNRNYWLVDLACRYFASAYFSVMFGINHKTRSYEDIAYASLEYLNFGGTTFSFEIEFLSNEVLRFNLGGKYMPQIEKSRTYAFDYENTTVHQMIPIEKPSRSVYSQKSYALSVSVAYLTNNGNSKLDSHKSFKNHSDSKEANTQDK